MLQIPLSPFLASHVMDSDCSQYLIIEFIGLVLATKTSGTLSLQYTRSSISTIIIICMADLLLRNSLFIGQSWVKSDQFTKPPGKISQNRKKVRDYNDFWKIKIDSDNAKNISKKKSKWFDPYTTMSSILGGHPQGPLTQSLHHLLSITYN